MERAVAPRSRSEQRICRVTRPLRRDVVRVIRALQSASAVGALLLSEGRAPHGTALRAHYIDGAERPFGPEIFAAASFSRARRTAGRHTSSGRILALAISLDSLKRAW